MAQKSIAASLSLSTTVLFSQLYAVVCRAAYNVVYTGRRCRLRWNLSFSLTHHRCEANCSFVVFADHHLGQPSGAKSIPASLSLFTILFRHECTVGCIATMESLTKALVFNSSRVSCPSHLEVWFWSRSVGSLRALHPFVVEHDELLLH